MNLSERILKKPFWSQVFRVIGEIFFGFLVPIAWCRSLFSARILAKGRWSNYMGFCPEHAITCLFYRTQYINIDRYGRYEDSPILGLGHFSLRKWFHISLFANFVYSNAGAVVTLVGTLFWLSAHLAWITHAQGWWVGIVTVIIATSSTSYSMAFAKMNYQILGWMWWPIILLLISSDQLLLASFALLGMALAGLTPIVLIVPIVFAMSFISSDPYVILTLMPGLVVSGIQVIGSIGLGSSLTTLKEIGGMIGAVSGGVRYKRMDLKLNWTFLYFCITYSFALFFMTYAAGEFLILPSIAIGIFVVNQSLFRIADIQSVIVVVLTIFAFEAIQLGPDVLVAVSLWTAANPIVSVLGINKGVKRRGLASEISYKPFDHSRLETALKEFLIGVPKDSSVYFAFDDPAGNYNHIFDGYRGLLELPFYVASQKEVHLFPDWWAVMETNYEGAPQCWGRSVSEVKLNCERFSADYAVIYDDTGKGLDADWLKEFDLMTVFDWNEIDSATLNDVLYAHKNPNLQWYLLKKISSSDS